MAQQGRASYDRTSLLVFLFVVNALSRDAQIAQQMGLMAVRVSAREQCATDLIGLY